jgi:hypothetical protein
MMTERPTTMIVARFDGSIGLSRTDDLTTFRRDIGYNRALETMI